MNRAIIFLIVMTIALAAKADYTVQTNQPLYPAQAVDYSTAQPYTQQYAQQYNQGYYQNPYQVQYQAQCVDPYHYRSPYLYGNSLPNTVVNSMIPGLGTSGASSQVVKNIGRSLLYSLLRGY